MTKYIKKIHYRRFDNLFCGYNKNFYDLRDTYLRDEVTCIKCLTLLLKVLR